VPVFDLGQHGTYVDLTSAGVSVDTSKLCLPGLPLVLLQACGWQASNSVAGNKDANATVSAPFTKNALLLRAIGAFLLQHKIFNPGIGRRSGERLLTRFPDHFISLST
jgi:hypothetical protein